MAKILFTSNLKRFYPDLVPIEIRGNNISEIIGEIDGRFPGIRNYIVDDQQRLRHHVNIFINENMIKDRDSLSDLVHDTDQIYIMQALSGG